MNDTILDFTTIPLNAFDRKLPDSDTQSTTSTESEIGPVSIVSCHLLCKRYGDFDALKDCSVRVPSGGIFGLLGPNGAGKTTLIRLLLGYLHPSSGHCEVAGIDPQIDDVAVRRQVSYLPGDARLPRHLRGEGVLKFFAEIHPLGDLERSRQIAERLELDTRRRVAFMSTGMRQKLALSVVLGISTPLLILDEPTANLDPTIRAIVLDLVREARDSGRSVIFSSHVLSEIEETCDQVAFLRHGQLAYELHLSDLYQRHRVWAHSTTPVDVPSELNGRVKVQSNAAMDGGLLIDTAGDLADFLPWIDSLKLENLRVEPLGLRSVYDAVHAGEKVVV